MRRILALLIALPLTGATRETAPPSPVSPATQDQGTYRLLPDTEARWVPFDLTPGNQIRFTMRLDDRDVTAILDTGVSFTLLGKGSPAVVAAKVRPGGNATAIGGSVAIGWMPTRTLGFGGLIRTGGGVAVAELPAIATGSAAAVDLLVGRDVLATYALDIDYANRRFRLIPSGRLPFRGESAPLTISADRRIYESAIRLGTRTLAPIVVDTGDGSSITVTAQGWRSAVPPAVPTTTAISFGLGGAVISGLAIAPEIRLGDLVARTVETRIEPAGGFSQSIGTAGRIGSGFLQNYRVLLDPNARRMVLSPGPHADTPPLRSTSGLLLGVERDKLKVLHVMRGGPAAASGWRDGDLICAIDGTPVPPDYASNPLSSWAVRPAGTTVSLKLCDGMTRALTLRSFY